MDNLPLLVLGIILIVLGIANIKGNISTIHYYNRRKVTENDIPKYGKEVGTGNLIIGASLIVSFIISIVANEIVGSIAKGIIILLSVIVGTAFILHAQFKYNKGIF